MCHLKRSKSKGLGLVEYGILAVFVLVLSISAVRFLAQATNGEFNSVARSLQSGRSPIDTGGSIGM